MQRLDYDELSYELQTELTNEVLILTKLPTTGQ